MTQDQSAASAVARMPSAVADMLGIVKKNVASLSFGVSTTAEPPSPIRTSCASEPRLRSLRRCSAVSRAVRDPTRFDRDVVQSIGALVFLILAAISAQRGEVYRYPISVRLVK